jgi:hypothetical protein
MDGVAGEIDAAWLRVSARISSRDALSCASASISSSVVVGCPSWFDYASVAPR